MNSTEFWLQLKQEAQLVAQSEPLLSSYLHACVLVHHNIESTLSYMLSDTISDETVSALALREMIDQAYLLSPELVDDAIADVTAVLQRDPAVSACLSVMLYFKGFKAIQIHRLANWLWQHKRRDLALFLQSRNSAVNGVDIHPAARLGKGLMFDHATGIVIGETCVIEDNVSLLQSVTLGGTGNESGDRHPKVRQGVMIGAGAKILGNIEIGEGSKVGAGSVVLSDVPPHVTVVGVPAKVVGKPRCTRPCESMQQNVLEDE
ncbi:serine O-acetyltransferase [Bowmanella sp. JS7-9]|uniref:Serine acetyltransferase n=1 Tax=Pseudobowmanella zhangzhouensis TaxID=1537679 RepID=A0ABW1XR35_9ALTE|nr:serine O-acetyltransferase [Bowmanella sp. JS7-9]TBX24458.1 serine acetyltransferase [Bowmanella sp. JS7-9]